MDQPVASLLSYVVPVTPGAPAAPKEPQFYPAAHDYMSYSGRRVSVGSALAAVGFAILILLIIVIAYHMWRPARFLVKCLANRGWVLYTRPGCGFCRDQLRVLGGYPKIVTCGQTGRSGSAGGRACAAVPAFPFWYNTRTGKQMVGLQYAGSLRKMARW